MVNGSAFTKVPISANCKDVCLQYTCKSNSYHQFLYGILRRPIVNARSTS